MYDRYYVRILEMRESLKILEQALKDIPSTSPHISPKGQAIGKAPRTFRPPKGEAYARVEAPKGELGFYLYSDGKGYPWRLKIRSPSFTNLQALPTLVQGAMISDVVAIIGSIDPVMGEADK